MIGCSRTVTGGAGARHVIRNVFDTLVGDYLNTGDRRHRNLHQQTGIRNIRRHGIIDMASSNAAMMANTPPAPAAAVGYNIETFGPSVTIGSNWEPFNFDGANPSAANVTQNADGSVTIAGGADTFNAQLSTASMITNGTANGQWQGAAFGGGLYVQATTSFSGPSYGLYGRSY